MAKIAVIGTGYVGLTTSIGLASLGHDVIGLDIDPDKINSLNSGKLPIFEPGLDEVLNQVLQANKLIGTTNIQQAIEDSDFVFTCVPTPQDEDGSADLSYVLNASKDISPFLKSGAIVITKSTVPVGSAQRVETAINRSDIFVASNPEFLREGSALADFNFPDRIVVGARTKEIGNQVMDLYEKIDCPKIITTQQSAELIKYASNSFLAIKLSFVNDMAALCESAGAEPLEVMRGFGLDSRIGNKFLEPGPGWGGSCFPKDTRALASIAEMFGIQIPLISAAISSNEFAHKRVADRVMNALGGSLVGKTIAVLGVTFKANTDDVRESPSIAVIQRLVGRGARVKAYDPMVIKPISEDFDVFHTALDAVTDSDALIVLTEWQEFSDLDSKVLLSVMKEKFVVDTRNILDKKEWEVAGAIFPKLKA